ncbi:MAG: sugar ABC transporter ATP-binding protein [Chloroflexi bacterium]|nr:sugar ABC transporter ATP-binding protein [Chloroflexota bacterium]
MTETLILEVRDIHKSYPGVQALAGVSLSLNAGEVRGLLGKNGAGKSTLIKILSGATRQDSGQILVGGQPVHIHSPADAFTVGIGTVYQEMSLIPGLTIAENVLLGRWPLAARVGTIKVIDRRETLRATLEALEMMGADLQPNTLVNDLSVPERQIVEIAKALSFKPKILILDEPTSSLPQAEVARLLKLVRQLAANGVAIIYVSHRLQEVPLVTDSISVLREGVLIGTIPVSESSPEVIARMMIGDTWKKTQTRTLSDTQPDIALEVDNLHVKGYLHGVSLKLHQGEVVGIAGLLGSGRTELLHAIFGLHPFQHGTITVNGEKIAHPTPTLMLAKGVGLTPEDRKLKGLVLPLTIEDNLTMSSMDRISTRQVVSPARRRTLAEKMITALAIKTASMTNEARSLSGGNQQKVVIGKWLNAGVRVLLMDEPTRGIDIQAKDQVYTLVRQLAAEGVAIIFVSSELEEVLEVADRILILNQGQIRAELPGAQAHLENVLALAMKKDWE